MKRIVLFTVLLLGILVFAFLTFCSTPLLDHDVIEPETPETTIASGEDTPSTVSPINDKHIEIVCSTWIPYEYEVDGVATGLGVEVTREAFRRAGYETTFTFLPFERALTMVKSGEADMLTDVNRIPEREAFAIFSEEAIAISETSLFVRADSDIMFNGDIFELAPHTFGVILGYTHGVEFDQAAEDGSLNVEYAQTMDQNVQKLVAGRIDVFIDNKLAVYHAVKELGLSGEVKHLEPPYREAALYNIFSKQNDLSDVRDAFDQALREMKEDGTYEEIYGQYLGDAGE